MNIAENTQRAETNPIAEILEPIRRRVLRKRHLYPIPGFGLTAGLFLDPG